MTAPECVKLFHLDLTEKFSLEEAISLCRLLHLGYAEIPYEWAKKKLIEEIIPKYSANRKKPWYLQKIYDEWIKEKSN